MREQTFHTSNCQPIPNSLKRKRTLTNVSLTDYQHSQAYTVHPNTEFPFPAASHEPLPHSSANVLNPQGIAELLKHYPNQRFVDTITAIATCGARVGYIGPLTRRIRRPNHTSSFTQAEIITAQIQNELAKKRIKQIPSLPLNYFCSPIGLTPKRVDGHQTGWRMIFDLSSPEGSSVNDGIPKEHGTIIYETLNDAIRLIAQAGKGAVMMKRDLKSAFHHIPISPCDY